MVETVHKETGREVMAHAVTVHGAVILNVATVPGAVMALRVMATPREMAEEIFRVTMMIRRDGTETLAAEGAHAIVTTAMGGTAAAEVAMIRIDRTAPAIGMIEAVRTIAIRKDHDMVQTGARRAITTVIMIDTAMVVVAIIMPVITIAIITIGITAGITTTGTVVGLGPGSISRMAGIGAADGARDGELVSARSAWVFPMVPLGPGAITTIGILTGLRRRCAA